MASPSGNPNAGGDSRGEAGVTRDIDMAGVPGGDQLAAARHRLAGRIRRTPLLEIDADELVQGSRFRLLLKLETLQHTGAFKVRGALNALLASGTPTSVVAASGGNHGAAVAWAATSEKVAAEIFVPVSAPVAKLERIASYGGRLHLIEGYYADALQASRAYVEEHGGFQIHAYDDPEVVAGQATCGAEILEQEPATTRVLVACGGGGLYAGTALGCGREVVVSAVEPELAPTLTRALTGDAADPVPVSGVAVDSLGAGHAGTIARVVAREREMTPLLVSDEMILEAQRWLWDRTRIAAEPGGAAAVAALLGRAVEPLSGEVVVAVVSGGNGPALSL
jgi:threonine dehydratase